MENQIKSTSLSWLEIDGKNLLHNLNIIRKKISKKVKICAVVKANAYGHGYETITDILKNQAIDFYAVHSFEEAVILSDLKVKPQIFIVGYVPLEQLKLAVEYGFHLIVYNIETVKKLKSLSTSKTAKIHLKLETGTNRQGITASDLPQFLKLIKNDKNIELIGAATHYANIEDTTDHSYADYQLATYREMIVQIEKAGFKLKIKHTASSAASLLFGKTHFDMIRYGISLYGLWPSKETYLSYRLAGGKNNLLKPALTWKTKITQIKKVPKGSFIGYGCTYRTTTNSRIAILPIGYFDGYDRNISNLGYVLIRGQRAPVRGRVCMDIIMVDVTNIAGVHLEDEVVLLGRQRDEVITTEQMAGWAQTINYEIISRISPLLPRIIV